MRLLLILPFSSLALANTARGRYAAQQVVPDGFTPRYFFLDRSHPLAKRDGSCGDGNHDCLDIQHPERCCNNDTYCYVNKDGSPRCCPLGSPCETDSPCPSTAYYCSTTITITSSGTKTASTTVQTGCCNRPCQEANYLCPRNLGGNCCPFGSNCQAGGNCVAVKTASPPPPGFTPAATGQGNQCSTSQFKCPDGTGCCNTSQVCTQFRGAAYCAASATPTSTTSIESDSDNSGGLSVGAKVGVSLGAVVGGSLVIGAAIWLFISKRRDRQGGDGSGGVGDGSHGGNSASIPHQRSNIQGSSNAASLPGDGGMTTIASSSPAWPQNGEWSGTASVSSPGPEHSIGVVSPVEIASSERAEAPVHESWSPRSGVTSTFTDLERRETIDGRFELYSREEWSTPTSPNLPQLREELPGNEEPSTYKDHNT